MITLHHEKETDFRKNGYGQLDNYIFNEGGSWELNGEFKIEFEMPALSPFTEFIKARNIVQTPVPFMNRQLFRIYRTEKNLDSIRVEARHIFYDLIGNWIEDTNIVNQPGNNAIQQILNNTQYPHRFVASSNIDSLANARVVRMNPVEAIIDNGKGNTFISRWGGELARDNFRIEMLNRRGVDDGIEIEHRKDLIGYESSIDDSTVVTRIQPVGFGGLMLPERYVDSDLIDPDNPIIKEIRYQDIKAAVGESADDEDAVPLEEAYGMLQQAAFDEFEKNNIDEPETVVEVDFVALHNTEQYKDLAQLQEVRGGDTVRIKIRDRNIEITSRLVAFEFSLLRENHYYSTTLGNHVTEFTSSDSNDNLVVREEVQEVRQQTAAAIRSANRRGRNFYIEVGEEKPSLETDAIREGDRLYEDVGEGQTRYYVWSENNEWSLEKVSGGSVSGTLDGEDGDLDIINLNANNVSAGALDLAKGIQIGHGELPVLYANSDGEVVMNVQNLLINSFDPEADSVHADDLLNYLRYSNGVVEIGERGAEVVTQFANDEWAMVRNGERVMWLERDVINIQKAHFFEQMQVGNFAFVPRANGSLDFKKVVD